MHRHILWSVDQSLKRLETAWNDLYIVYREDPLTPLEEMLSALDAVVRAGKGRYLGFSHWSAWKAAAALEMQRAHGLAWHAGQHDPPPPHPRRGIYTRDDDALGDPPDGAIRGTRPSSRIARQVRWPR